MPFYDNFSAQAPTRAGAAVARRESANLLRAILRRAPQARALLELGPGRGTFAAHCLARGLDYTCADISRPLLEALPVARRVRTLVPRLPFASEAFDVTFAANLLEHMPGFAAALELLGEMARVTRPGGLVCHRVPDAMGWGLHFWNGDYTHSFFTTPRTVTQACLDAGLRIEALHPVAGFAIGPSARLAGLLGRLVPSWIIGHGADPTRRFSKSLYSLKTTFLPGFLIIARKD